MQDADPQKFAAKLQAVFRECRRILKNDGLLIFSYHHSREQGWQALATAIFGAGFAVVNSHPVKAEMSGATPKSQAKEPTQLDMILVCRKQTSNPASSPAAPSFQSALNRARAKLSRLTGVGFALTRNDRKIVIYGQLLTAIRNPAEILAVFSLIAEELDCPLEPPRQPPIRQNARQGLLFDGPV